jgi:hypothetical protein
VHTCRQKDHLRSLYLKLFGFCSWQ